MNAPAATSHLTDAQRVAAIQAGVQSLLSRMPTGWENWTADRVQQFKGAVQQMQRARSLATALGVAHMVGAYYGRAGVEFDPGHGA